MIHHLALLRALVRIVGTLKIRTIRGLFSMALQEVENVGRFYRLKGSETMEEGVVKWFNKAKGFGFITRDSGDDVFVHYRQIAGDGFKKLEEGERVQFELIETPKGLQATEVSVV